MSPEPSSWPVRRQPSRPRPSPGPVQPRHAAGAAHEVRAGALPVERASHGEGTGRTACAGLELRPQHGLQVCSQMAGETGVRVGPTRLSQPSVRGTAGDSLLWAGPVQQCCLDLARASWLCGPLLSAAVAPPWCGTPCPSPPLSMDSQGLPSISATGHCHEAPREPVRVSSPLRAGAARTRGSLHLPKVATATSPAARAPLKERP